MAIRRNKKIKITKIKKRQSIFSFISANFNSLIVIFLILLVVIYLGYSNWNIYKNRSAIISQVQELKKTTQELEEKNKELNLGLSQLSDEYYLERIAREKMGFKKPGEEVVVIIPPPEKENIEIEENKSFWENFKESIKDFFNNL